MTQIKHWVGEFQSFCCWLKLKNIILLRLYQNEMISRTCVTFEPRSTGLGEPGVISEKLQPKVLIFIISHRFFHFRESSTSIGVLEPRWCDSKQRRLQLVDSIFALLSQLNRSGAKVLWKLLLDSSISAWLILIAVFVEVIRCCKTHRMQHPECD